MFLPDLPTSVHVIEFNDYFQGFSNDISDAVDNNACIILADNVGLSNEFRDQQRCVQWLVSVKMNLIRS